MAIVAGIDTGASPRRPTAKSGDTEETRASSTPYRLWIRRLAIQTILQWLTLPVFDAAEPASERPMRPHARSSFGDAAAVALRQWTDTEAIFELDPAGRPAGLAIRIPPAPPSKETSPGATGIVGTTIHAIRACGHPDLWTPLPAPALPGAVRRPARGTSPAAERGSARPVSLAIALPPHDPLRQALIGLASAFRGQHDEPTPADVEPYFPHAHAQDHAPVTTAGRRWEIVDGLYQSLLALSIEPAEAQPDSIEPQGHSAQERLHPSAGRTLQAQLGAWYTPQLLIDRVLNEAIGPSNEVAADSDPHTPGADAAAHRPIRIIDPACGSGRMLVMAFERLLQRLHRSGRATHLRTASSLAHTGSDRATRVWPAGVPDAVLTVLEGFHGIDIDPIAVSLARLALFESVVEAAYGSGAMHAATSSGEVAFSHAIARVLNCNIVCAHALLDPPKFASQLNSDHSDTLNIRSGFHAVIGNPPFVDSESGVALDPKERRRIATAFPYTCRGNWDLFVPFVELATRLTRPGGRVALVLPVAAIASDYVASLHEHLLTHGDITAIHDCSADTSQFSGASVAPIVLSWSRHDVPPPAGDVSSARPATTRYIIAPRKGRGRAAAGASIEVQVDGANLRRLPPGFLSYPLVRARESDAAADPLHDFATELQAELRWIASAALLGDLAEVSDGATTAEAYQLRAFIEERPDDAGSDTTAPPTSVGGSTLAPCWIRLVNTGTIDPFHLLWGRRSIRYLGFRGPHPQLRARDVRSVSPRRHDQALHPGKVVVAGLATRLEAAVAGRGVLCGKSAVLIIPRTAADAPGGLSACPHAVTAYLNSAPANRLYRRLFGHRGLDHRAMCIGPRQIRRLPIPDPHWFRPFTDDATSPEGRTALADLMAHLLQDADLDTPERRQSRGNTPRIATSLQMGCALSLLGRAAAAAAISATETRRVTESAAEPTESTTIQAAIDRVVGLILNENGGWHADDVGPSTRMFRSD